jgi:hypothetical protein
MGKQVEFYMTKEDEMEFVRYLRGGATVRLMYNSIEGEEEEEVRDVLPLAGGRASNLSLVNLDVVPEVVFYPAPLGMRIVNVAESDVVQFNRCESKDGFLLPGRLWFEERALGRTKPEEFKRWARSLLAWIRRAYSRDGDDRFVGPNAETMFRSTGLRPTSG